MTERTRQWPWYTLQIVTFGIVVYLIIANSERQDDLARHFINVGVAAAFIVTCMTAGVIDTHRMITKHKVLPWMWFPAQILFALYVFSQLPPAGWEDYLFRVAAACLIAFYATWLLAKALLLPHLYRRDFVQPRLEREARQKAARDRSLSGPASDSQNTQTQIDSPPRGDDRRSA